MFDKIKQLFNRGNNHSLVGRTLRGHYQIIAELHHGGIGETYLAIDLDMPINPKPKFVVKRILPQMKDNPDIIRLFNTEAEILCKLNHNQIPKLRGYFTENRDFYLVQEYIEGSDLSGQIGNMKYHNTLPTLTFNKTEKKHPHQIFKELPPATIPRRQWDELMVIQLVKEILEVLQYVHQMGVIHRDIKPSNLMRRKCDGKLILIDFGSVKEVATQVINAQGKSAYTMKIGTPGYLPSEQALGRPNFSSDIYAVGMTAIQALTGISPYSLPNEKNEIKWRDFANVSDQLANFLNKMVRYDCYDRYQNAKEAMQALNRIYMQAETSFLTEQLINKQDFFSLGYQKLELGDYQGAIADYNSAIELNPNYTIAYNNRGNAYRNLKEYQKAIADYNRAIELNPNYTIAYNNRGNAYRNLKEYQKAIADYNKAIDLNPKDAIAYNNRGNAYRNLKEYQKALSDYNKAIELNPNLAEAYNNRGNAYYDLKEYEKAIGDYNCAIELNFNYTLAYNNRGAAYRNLKEYEKAIADYDQAIELNLHYANAYYNRGLAYQDSGNKIQAMESFRQAIALYQQQSNFQGYQDTMKKIRELENSGEWRMET